MTFQIKCSPAIYDDFQIFGTTLAVNCNYIISIVFICFSSLEAKKHAGEKTVLHREHVGPPTCNDAISDGAVVGTHRLLHLHRTLQRLPLALRPALQAGGLVGKDRFLHLVEPAIQLGIRHPKISWGAQKVQESSFK